MNLDLWKEKTKGLFHITEYKSFWNYIDNLKMENQRLNKVVNELEKYINNTESYYSIGDIQKKYRMVEVNDVLHKLKELKESDK